MKIQCYDMNMMPDGCLPDQESPYFPPVLMTWIELYRAFSRIPRKSEFDPVHFPKSLPYSWIYEYLDGENDFLCRLSGSLIDEAWGEPLSDRRACEFMSDTFRQNAMEHLRKVIEKPALMHIRRYLDSRLQPVEKLILPLADDNDRIRYVFGVSHYQYRPNRFETETTPDFLHYFQLKPAGSL